MARLWALTLTDEYRRALQTITGDGAAWMLAVFRWAVVHLVWWAEVLGVSYETLNVWLFVILLPGALLASLSLNVYLLRRVRGLQSRDRESCGVTSFAQHSAEIKPVGSCSL